MLRAPIKKSLVSYWFTFGTLTLVVRADKFPEILDVGEVKGNVGCVKPLPKVFEFSFKDVQHNAKVTGNGN